MLEEREAVDECSGSGGGGGGGGGDEYVRPLTLLYYHCLFRSNL